VSVADRFVGRYYVEIHHARALELAAGPAAARVEREMALLIEARRPGAGAVPSHPRVYFERVGDPEEREGAVRITYRLSVEVPMGRPLERHVSVELRKVGDAWRVVNFAETG
jgi:hypothetical protein